ncbi:MAG: hypothetical protein WHS44_00525 [Fimbriimonadales bacterium]|nr:MAG: hypothetical protein KatS3mg018_0844 [Fimbriimonadales bacterium]
MRELQIKVNEQDWERLQDVAARLGCTAEEYVERTLRNLLVQVLPPSEEWQQRFDALLQQIRQHTAQFSPEEIEAEITAAWEEYRKECGS